MRASRRHVDERVSGFHALPSGRMLDSGLRPPSAVPSTLEPPGWSEKGDPWHQILSALFPLQLG